MRNGKWKKIVCRKIQETKCPVTLWHCVRLWYNRRKIICHSIVDSMKSTPKCDAKAKQNRKKRHTTANGNKNESVNPKQRAYTLSSLLSSSSSLYVRLHENDETWPYSDFRVSQIPKHEPNGHLLRRNQ